MNRLRLTAAALAVAYTSAAFAQPDDPLGKKNKGDAKPEQDRVVIVGDGPPGGPGGPGAPGGPRMFGPMGGGEIKLVARFDKNGDRRLDKEERKPALEALKKERGNRRGFGPPGGFPGGPPGDAKGGFPPFPPPGMEDDQPKGKNQGNARPPGDKKGGEQGPQRKMFRFGPGMEKRDPAKPGKKISPADVKPAGDKPLYDLETVRTLFLEFESDGWEKELEDFHGTDVEIPATLTVDGKKYPGVGVHFRGASSYGMVPATYKRSLDVSVDFTNSKQRLLGRKTLNLLNGHDDPSMMGTVLYSTIANKYLPAPKANFTRVVVNGENWGVYTNVEQFDREFVEDHYKTAKGFRWKVRGSPMGRGGLEYLGDNPEEYQRIYDLKGGDDAKAWPKLIKLCKTLNEGPLETLEERLKPLLDIDGVLRFLAVENALINCDGYWIRASDYSIICDAKGVFHIVPHDMNEAFRTPMGPGIGPPPGMFGIGKRDDAKAAKDGKGIDQGPPGKGPPDGRGPGRRMMMGPPGSGKPDLDPLHGLDDAKKPLRSRLLSVPALRARYLGYVKQIAQEDLDPKNFLTLVAKCRAMIESHVAEDTRKLSPTEDFLWATGATKSKPREGGFGMPKISLKEFAEQRRQYLLSYKPSQAPKAAKTKDAD